MNFVRTDETPDFVSQPFTNTHHYHLLIQEWTSNNNIDILLLNINYINNILNSISYIRSIFFLLEVENAQTSQVSRTFSSQSVREPHCTHWNAEMSHFWITTVYGWHFILWMWASAYDFQRWVSMERVQGNRCTKWMMNRLGHFKFDRNFVSSMF